MNSVNRSKLLDHHKTKNHTISSKTLIYISVYNLKFKTMFCILEVYINLYSKKVESSSNTGNAAVLSTKMHRSKYVAVRQM